MREGNNSTIELRKIYTFSKLAFENGIQEILENDAPQAQFFSKIGPK
jgi:hypothetical protein